MSRGACNAALALSLVARSVLGQAPRDTTARIVGTVRSSVDGLPIAGVMIALRRAQAFGVSDTAGAFSLAGLPPGPQTIRVLYGDSLSYDQAVTLKRGKTLTLSVLLDVSAVALSPIVVEARSLRAERTLAGFYERKKWGWGRFYTLADLDRHGAQSLRMLLGEAGVYIRCGGLGGCLPVSFAGGCVMSIFLDGMLIGPEFLDGLRVDELAGVEVYKHALDVPIQFRFGFTDTFRFGSAGTGSCGAILLWSRY